MNYWGRYRLDRPWGRPGLLRLEFRLWRNREQLDHYGSLSHERGEWTLSAQALLHNSPLNPTFPSQRAHPRVLQWAPLQKQASALVNFPLKMCGLWQAPGGRLESASHSQCSCQSLVQTPLPCLGNSQWAALVNLS